MAKRILFLDFETYYDNEYSLRKLSPPEYILDDRFEMQMCAVAVDDEPSHTIDGPDFPAYLQQFDPKDTATVTFNSLFDNAILAWVYGFVPYRMYDTLGMSRSLLGHALKEGAALAKVGEHLGVGQKGTTIQNVMGMQASQIKSNGLWGAFSAYANQDNEMNRKIFKRLISDFPWSEQRLMDLTLRCAIEPRFRVDVDMLRQHLDKVRAEKALLLQSCGADQAALMSAPKFAKVLEDLGVTVETKVSPTGKTIPALAKTDGFMESLTEHPDLRVQAVAAARLGLKSTIEETRCEKLLKVASLPWDRYRDGSPRLYSGGTMPVPLKYGGAHTHRLSGDWGMNLQNLPTKRGSKGKSKLRDSLIAPPGHTVITADLGQIEARLNAWISKAKNLLEQFAKYDAGDKAYDPYNRLGSAIFKCPVNRKLVGTVDEIMGFIGKTGILGLGYGAGQNRFLDMVIKTARQLGLSLDSIGGFDILRAAKAVQTYRSLYHPIPGAWRRLDFLLESAWMGYTAPMKFGPVEIGHGYVMPPNGLPLRYHNPRTEPETGEKHFTYGRHVHKIYGAKFLENIVQNLARIVVMNAALRLADLGHKFVLQAHDELVFIVPDEQVAEAKSIIHREMVRRPSWATDLPLTADVGTGKSYGEAK